MKNYTTLEIIHALPLDVSLKDRLIKEFPTYDEDERREIAEVCWGAFHEMVRALEAYWLDRITDEVGKGIRSGTPDVSRQVYEVLRQDLDERISGKIDDDIRLDTVRAKLQSLAK